MPIVIEIRIPPVDPEEFINAAREGRGAEYFKSFRIGNLLKYGQPLTAFSQGLRILGECLSADQHAFATIHKGGLYYWIATAAHRIGDFESAIYFIDAAVERDINRPQPQDDTPALMFIHLDDGPEAQAAREEVSAAKRRVDELIATYNSYPGSTRCLSLDDVRNRLLLKALQRPTPDWRSLSTTLISFVLEHRLREQLRDNVVAPATKEPFYLHLFKGCLLFESLLKANPSEPTTKDALGAILKEAKIYQALGFHAEPLLGSATLPQVLNSISARPPTIQDALLVTYKARNTVGHSVLWDTDITLSQCQSLYQVVATSCLHTLSCLYT